MQPLNLPTYTFKIKSSENNYVIFDIIRKKYVVLTPEEWVRQHIVNYLMEEKKYPISLIAVEKKLILNNLTKRTDILVFNNKGSREGTHKTTAFIRRAFNIKSCIVSEQYMFNNGQA